MHACMQVCGVLCQPSPSPEGRLSSPSFVLIPSQPAKESLPWKGLESLQHFRLVFLDVSIPSPRSSASPREPSRSRSGSPTPTSWSPFPLLDREQAWRIVNDHPFWHILLRGTQSPSSPVPSTALPTTSYPNPNGRKGGVTELVTLIRVAATVGVLVSMTSIHPVPPQSPCLLSLPISQLFPRCPCLTEMTLAVPSPC